VVLVIQNGSCSSIEIRVPDVSPPVHNATGNYLFTVFVCFSILINFTMLFTEKTYLYLNATDYLGSVSAFSGIGSYILTVGYNISGDQVREVSNYYYDLSGFYSDYFKIGRRSGQLTVARSLTSRTYSFDVSFFYTVTYKNGTVTHNYTEADIYVNSLGKHEISLVL